MSDLLTALPIAVADRIKLLLPNLLECKAAAGRYNVERLMDETIRAPGVIVSILQMKQVKGNAGPQHFYHLDMAAFIITKDKLGLPRDEAASNIAMALAALIPDKRWGHNDAGQAENVRGQSLVTAASLKVKASLWAVTWTQPVTFTVMPVSETLDPVFYVGLAPKIGEAHIEDYEQIGGGQ